MAENTPVTLEDAVRARPAEKSEPPHALEHPLMAPDVAACALRDLPCPLLRSGRSCSGARSGVHSRDGGYGLVLGFHKQERIPLAEGID